MRDEDMSVDVACCNSATQLLHDRGVNPGVADAFDFGWEVGNGQVHVVRYLCELPGNRGVNPGAGDNKAIRSAAANGHVDVVRYLCELPPATGDDGDDDDR